MANEYDITRAFKRIENELMRSMVRNLERHKAEETKEGYNWEQWQAIQLRELERYRRDNSQKFRDEFTSINKQIRDLYRATKDDAQTKEEAKILEHIKKGDFKPSDIKNDVTFFGVNDAKLSAMIDAANADFTKAEYAMLRKANDEYRKIIFDAQMYAASGAATYDKAVDMATHDFLKAGIQSVVYKNGARHTLEDYSRMAIRTGNKRAYLMGEGNAHDKYGIHTVRVNKRENACPLCVGFLGRVLVDDVYSGGTAKEAAEAGVPTLSQAMAQGFLHPNCKDIYSLYIEGVSKPAEPWTQDEINNIVGDYTLEQELQHAEDMAETYKRMHDLSLDPENQKRYGLRSLGWDMRADEIREEIASGQTRRVVNVTPPVVTPPVVPTVAQTEAQIKEAEIRTRIADIKTKLHAITDPQQVVEEEIGLLKDAKAQWDWWLHLYGDSGAEAKLLERIADRQTNGDRYGDLEKFLYLRDNLDMFRNGTSDAHKAFLEGEVKEYKKQARKIQKQLDAEYNNLGAVVGKPNMTNLTAYGEKHIAALEHYLYDAPQEYWEAWQACADNFHISRNKQRGDFYSPLENAVNLHITSDAKGSNYQMPYETFFHEYGHNMDYVMNMKFGNKQRMEAFTTTYKGGIFGKTIMKEADEAITAFAKAEGYMVKPTQQTVNAEAYRLVQKGFLDRKDMTDWVQKHMTEDMVDRSTAEKKFCDMVKAKLSMKDRANISDMFESSMDISMPFDAGHGTGYWYRKGNRWAQTGKEAFAEMYSSVLTNPRSWAAIQEYFPESVKIFHEILEVTKL